MTPPANSSFVPLTAASAPTEPRELKVAVMQNKAKEATFHSLDPLRGAAPAAAGEPKLCEPKVTVQRDGNRITHLRVQCSCGQIMDLACVYDETPPPAMV